MGRSKKVHSKELGSADKPRSKKEKGETNIMEETQEIYIPQRRERK